MFPKRDCYRRGGADFQSIFSRPRPRPPNFPEFDATIFASERDDRLVE
jgi:hypothetical protein